MTFSFFVLIPFQYSKMVGDDLFTDLNLSMFNLIPINVISDGASLVSFVAKSLQDYGTLQCWAENEIGKMEIPCLFNILPAGKYLHVLLVRKDSVYSKYRILI